MRSDTRPARAVAAGRFLVYVLTPDASRAQSRNARDGRNILYYESGYMREIKLGNAVGKPLPKRSSGHVAPTAHKLAPYYHARFVPVPALADGT